MATTENNNPPLVSQHQFLFPFKWSFPGREEQERHSLEAFQARLTHIPLPGDLKWERKPYVIAEVSDYNEYLYFYDFVRDILDDHGKESPQASSQGEGMLRHFELPCSQKEGGRACLTYQIEYADPVEKDSLGNPKLKTYSLDVTFLALNLYQNGVGVLVLQADNYTQGTTPEDVLRINDFGRRVFPPFLVSEGKGVLPGDNFAASLRLNYTDHEGNPHTIGEKGYPARGVEGNTLTAYQQHPLKLPHLIRQLLGEADLLISDGQAEGANRACLQLYPVLDDRMFVIAWYVNDALMDKARAFPPDDTQYATIDLHPLARHGKITGPPEQVYGYVKDPWASDFWYRYIFVDPPGEWNKGLANELMQERLLLAHTYDRWVEWGTLYGISRYSVVCLVNRDVPQYIRTHLQTMYYKMAELLLVQRAAILHFSDQVTQLTTGDAEDPRLVDRIRALYHRYIQFVNKIHFREVTAQEQGIELYNLLREKMCIERDVKDLDQEISELHTYAAMLEENQRNRRLEWLTIIGAVLLLPTFIAGFFGMNVFNDDLQPYSSRDYWQLTSLILGVGLSTFLSLRLYFLSKRSGSGKAKRGWAIFLGVVTVLLTLFILLAPLKQARDIPSDPQPRETLQPSAPELPRQPAFSPAPEADSPNPQ